MEATSMDIVVRHKSGCKDPDYFKKYYQANNKGVQIQCPRCNKVTSKVNMSKHVKRNICLKACVIGMVEEISEDNDIHQDKNENNLKTKHIY